MTRLLLRRAHVGAALGQRVDEALIAEYLDGVPYGRSGDAVFLHELALRRQDLPGLVDAALDLFAEDRSELEVDRRRVVMINGHAGERTTPYVRPHHQIRSSCHERHERLEHMSRCGGVTASQAFAAAPPVIASRAPTS